MFYDGQLINAANPTEANFLCNWEELPKKGFPAMFIHSDKEEAREPDSPSWFNFEERNIVCDIVLKLLINKKLGVSGQGIILEIEIGLLFTLLLDIGVISPYRKQVQKIIGTFHQYIVNRVEGSDTLRECKIGTVENFQGQVNSDQFVHYNQY